MIKIGIIGSGKIASWFLNEIKLINEEDVVLSGIYSTNKKVASEYADKWGIERNYDDLDDLINTGMDLIYIATPDQFHYEISKKILNKGINVYCEKPITWTKKEAIELYETAAKQNVLFFDGIKTGFSPAYIKMKEKLEEGAIGDIVLLNASHTKVSTSLRIPEPDRGVVTSGSHYGAGVYAAFMILDIAGEIDNFDYRTNSYRNNSAIATTAILSRHKNGAISTLMSSDHTTDNLMVVVQGTKGYITLGGKLDEYPKDYNKDNCHMAHTFEIRDLANKLIEKFDFPFETDGEGLRFTISHVLDLIRNGKTESPIMTRKISLDILELMESTNNSK